MPLLPQHAFEDHTAEVRLRIEAPTLAGIFREAALGLVELLVRDAVRPGEGREERVSLHAADAGALLVDWLNELVYLSEVRGRVFSDITIDRATETELAARLRGFVPGAIVTAVKAATLHEVRVDPVDGGYVARVVLDV